MANEEKIRILDEQPAENAGSLLYIRTLAGSSDASKPTSLLANGSVFIETDTGKVFIFDEDNGWTEMQAGSSLPPVTPSDNGKVATVEDGAWAARDNRFFVTLTVYNMNPIQGTMNHTIGEIEDAYNAGKRIIFRLSLDGEEWWYSEANIANSSGDIFMVEFMSIIGGVGLILGYTSGTSDKTSTDFGIDVYSLTPAS